ncbi:MAG: hypothetical protein K9K93_04045 [Acholeplasmataceae bacterium]|nr:hypothetical protein [Acholeplasmataceae bacterium]
MNLSNDFMLTLDKMRLAKKVSVSDLCQDIITERTYYRMLKADHVRTSTFTALIERLGIELSEFIHHTTFVRKNDSRFKFIYRVHTAFYRDIDEHYENVRDGVDPNIELDLLLNVYVKRYEWQSGKITEAEYLEHLSSLIPDIHEDAPFNIYLFNIRLFILEAFPDTCSFSLEQAALQFEKVALGFSVNLSAVCYDMILHLLMTQQKHEAFHTLIAKYVTFITYFPNRYFIMRLNLYKAYLGKITNDQTMRDRYLYKYLINVLSMENPDNTTINFAEVRHVFGIDHVAFLRKKTEEILRGTYD